LSSIEELSEYLDVPVPYGPPMASRGPANARGFHLITFLVVSLAVVLQLVLVIQGAAHIPADTDPDIARAAGPDLVSRLVGFFSFLTIWSNILVLIVCATLAVGADRDTALWRALRLDAVILCFGGGIVHFFLIRPHVDNHGWDRVADKLLHMVVPLLAGIGWIVFGPRGRAAIRDIGPFLVIPVFWLVYTLIRGAFVDWYPYPFIDVNVHGYAAVLATSLGVTVLMLVLAFGAVKLDKTLTPD